MHQHYYIMSSTTPIDMCANCGKGEEHSNKLKTCTACLSVKYCSRDCQAAHRKQHKKACKQRAAEYIMKSYLPILRHLKSVQSACYPYHLMES